MSELIVVEFEDPYQADHVLTEMTRLQTEYLVDLEDAVIVVRRPDGKVRIKQSISTTGVGAVSGGMWGAMFGSLVGLLLLNPLAGLAVGGALGASTGALSGAMSDYGIKDEFIRSMGETLQPDSSALFVLVRKAQPEKVLQAMSKFNGRVLRSSLSPEQEAKLQKALSQEASATG